MKKIFYLCKVIKFFYMRTIIFFFSCFILFFQTGCSSQSQDEKWSVRFADSEMRRFPEAWQLDHGKRYVWSYANGLGCLAMLKIWHYTGDDKYYDYVYQWVDYLVQPDGTIYRYDIREYNIDFINAGKLLFDIYERTGEEKFRMAKDTLMSQLATHPKTSCGVYWHKLIYPHQIWLDGIYMAGPFLAQYGLVYNRPELIDLAIHEVVKTYEHTECPTTGLLFHAYDESGEQLWANLVCKTRKDYYMLDESRKHLWNEKVIGQSPNFWGRAMGWYFMAMVDILDFVPEDHPGRQDVINCINKLAAVLPKYQHETGIWYQVIDMGTHEDNYLEASVTSMFMYCYAKSVNKGYLPKEYLKVAEKAFEGLTTLLMREDEDGTLNLTQCCSVGGLGGRPYRDGSFEYYMSEKIRDNDSKATGPFIMGCLELGK